MKTRYLIMFFAVVLFCNIGFVYAESHAPEVKVITRPEWVSGDVAVYIHSFPVDGSELEQESIVVMVSVWNADDVHPVLVLLDGEEAVRITENGYFRYEWRLRGSHRIVMRDEYRIFKTADFNIESPPPPPVTIPVKEFHEKLEEQFTQVFTFACMAAVAGVPSGVWIKKKTKIVSEWAILPFMVGAGIGLLYLPSMYMLVPWTTVTILTYVLARGYASQQVILVASEGMIDFHDYTLDDKGYIVEDIGPVHWRTGFIKRRKMTLVDNKYPVDFRYRGEKIRCVTVAGPEFIEDNLDEIRVTCSPELAQALNKKDVIEHLEDQVARTNFKLVFMERALGSVISEAVLEMERVIEDLRLDDLSSVSEAQERVELAASRLGESLKDQLVGGEKGE